MSRESQALEHIEGILKDVDAIKASQHAQIQELAQLRQKVEDYKATALNAETHCSALQKTVKVLADKIAKLEAEKPKAFAAAVPISEDEEIA